MKMARTKRAMRTIAYISMVSILIRRINVEAYKIGAIRTQRFHHDLKKTVTHSKNKSCAT